MIENLNKKTLFLFLTICVIPFVGAFVGLVLIIIGYRKNKNKSLIRVGFFGIITTILTYSIAISFSDSYNKKTYENNERLTKKTLTFLKLGIIQYKIDYNHYPQDLMTLSKSNETLIINDPILLFKMEDNIKTTFEYETDGKKFKLFSVGIDEKANTKDDIYP